MKTMENKKEYKKYDLELLNRQADIFQVMDVIGLEYKKRRYGKAQILCPSSKHNDQHYGSCIVDDKGWKCFSCGAHGDSLDLIMEHLNCKSSRGIEILLGIVGNKSSFVMGKDVPVVLSTKECELIGLRNNPVIVPAGYRSYLEPDDKELAEVDVDTLEPSKTLYPDEPERNPDICYIINRVAEKNPLLLLKQSSNWEYSTLVQRYAEQAMKDAASWLSSPENIGVFDGAANKINAIKAMLGRHGIRYSRATADVVREAMDNYKAAKETLKAVEPA